jgi:hypothetical protein
VLEGFAFFVFKMSCAKLWEAYLWSLTILFLACSSINLNFLILSEIKFFSWIQYMTKGVLEVLVRNLTIPIFVKFVEDVLEFIISKDYSPMWKNISEFEWPNTVLFANTYVLKRFFQCGPLHHKFIFNFFHVDFCRLKFVVKLLSLFLFSYMLIKIWVS